MTEFLDSAVIQMQARLADGSTYSGDMPVQDEIYKGVHNLENGDKYEGTFRNGKYHGVGTYFLSRYAETYTGRFVSGKKCGRGVTKYGGTIRHEGLYEDDQRSGKGITFGSLGSVYRGMYENDQHSGTGFYLFEQKDGEDRVSYMGEWQTEMHGEGVLTMKDGTVFQATFVKGKMTGPAFVCKPCGYRYEGMLVNGKEHGQGKCWYGDKSTFEGEWENGFHKEGERIEADGCVYRGQFSPGYKRNGEGMYTNSVGGIFYGEWKHNAFDGWGYTKDEEGEIFQGQFKDGQRHGYGRMVTNGCIYEGQWCKGTKLTKKSEHDTQKAFDALTEAGKTAIYLRTGFDPMVHGKYIEQKKEQEESEEEFPRVVYNHESVFLQKMPSSSTPDNGEKLTWTQDSEDEEEEEEEEDSQSERNYGSDDSREEEEE